jgi:cell wall-associated NlpC family hydrolase
MPSREDIIRVARTYIGTPFHHQGRLKGVGIDCVGLPVCVARELGIPLVDYTSYPRRPNGKTLQDAIERNMDRLSLEEVGIGDLLVFKLVRFPCHVGFRTDLGVLHTYEGVGAVVEHSLTGAWLYRAVFGYRYRGMQWQ